jgi:hypothetical protein
MFIFTFFLKKSEEFGVNVFETVWIKYGGSIKEDMLNSYVKNYVPFYTEVMYARKRQTWKKFGNQQRLNFTLI